MFKRRLVCSTLLLSVSSFSWGIEEILVTGTRTSGENWQPWGSNNYTELTQLNQNGASGYVEMNARPRACEAALRDIDTLFKNCRLQAVIQYSSAVDICPPDAQVSLSDPKGVLSVSINPRTACIQRADAERNVALFQCEYKKAQSIGRHTRECPRQ